MKEKVVVGLSGGVDSSVAAYLLKEAGYDVIGIFMQNWHDTSVTISDECPWIDDSQDALLVAEKLNIPFQVLDLSEEYKERIVDYMFAEYEAGRTPNPDVLCNREIKFDVFLKAAEKLGADYVATGHYCRKAVLEDGTQQLLAGKDPNKDQSYFLCQLSQDQLKKSLFPIGELLKSEVRTIAAELDLVTAEKKDSQGLCFIGKVKLPVFLQQQLTAKEGDIIRLDEELSVFKEYQQNIASGDYKELSHSLQFQPEMGKVVGKHQGAHFFTVGQRKGLAVGGHQKPLFVLGTDVEKNIIYTGEGEDHPGLSRMSLFMKEDDVHWIREDMKLKIGDSLDVLARIRYRQPLVKAKLHQEVEGLYMEFVDPMKSITPGQFAAWYLDDELIGSGVIQE